MDQGCDHSEDRRLDRRQLAKVRSRTDAGQAFPVYIAVIAGLLFLAFVYFAFGQAAATRNSAQTAADAAALAAAQDARDQLREGWLGVILDPAQWGGFVEGKDFTKFSACQQAATFAAKNGARISGGGCVRLFGEYEGFSVTVETTGAEAQHATAFAKAVIEPKCSFKAPETPMPEETEPDPDPTEPEEGPAPEPIIGLKCDGDAWPIDPDDPELPGAVDLFTVRLAGDDE
ncbi:pilus assembly protein TadG-related protein [Streptomyces sp. NPDC056508]|uniref:pilus assembly protein TadG-related protein n=1 Tax=Streptomyces sp. NPDC056508 TaxID=3345845 RepID=UPI00369B2A43